MQTSRRLWIVIALLGLAGAALFVTLFVRHGVRDITAAFVAAGWGIAAVVAFHLVPLLCDVLGWRALIPRQDRFRLLQLYWIRWCGDSVSSMLPVAQVGGEIVRVRLAAKKGMRLTIAVASVLVGMTVSVFTQIPFTLSGLALLFILTHSSNLTVPVLVASLAGVLALAGFYAVQRYGMFRFIAVIVSHVAKSPAWEGIIQRGEELDNSVRELYTRRYGLVMSCLWTMGAWATGAVEVWIALRAMGVKANYGQCYVMESISQGIRSVMFLVPGALGVQEGGYLAVGTLLGFSPVNAMALALIRRVRELAFGVPGVAAWQWFEWRHRPGQSRDLPTQAQPSAVTTTPD